MSLAIVAATAFTANVTGIPQYLQQKEALSDQRAAEQRAAQQAREQAAKAERDFNRLNQKKPNLASMLDGNAAYAAGGVGSTMLTGPQGADMSGMRLGRTSLLGA